MGNSSFFFKDRKGLAKALKVVIILLLVVASMAILFVGIRTLLKYNANNMITPSYNADLKISQVQIMDYNDVSVKVKSILYDDKLQGVNFIVYGKDGNEMGRYQAPISELKDNNYQVVLSVDNTSNIKTVIIAPVTLSKSGQEIVGSAADQYKITGTGTVFTPIPEDTGYASEAVVYCTSASECKDSDPCTTGACSKGLCSYPKIPGCEFCEDNSQCNDNNSCTNNICDSERCTYPIIEGCQSCAYNFQCEDNNPCTADSCVDNGCLYTPITNCTACTLDTDCEDYNSCTNNVCSNGRCSYPVITNCKICNASSQCNDNNICTNDTCVDGGCVYTPMGNCSSCTLDSQCNDNNGCTTYKCSSEGKCTYTPVQNCKACISASQCNDNNSCTTDGCLKGACTYTATSTCKNCTSASQCADTNPCTADSCSNGICTNMKITNCTYCTSVLQCEDNNPCTIHACTNNTCTYSLIGGCSICTANSQCNDNNPNTTDTCTGNKCVHNSQENNSCTLNSECTDNDSCTTDTCSSGACSHIIITTCANNDACCPTGCNITRDNNCAAVATCGNGIREGTEKCDSNNLGGATCSGVRGAGYTGTLKCSNCEFDTSLCVAPCTCPDEGNVCTTDICQNNVCQHILINNCCTSVSQCTNSGTCKTSVCSGNRCSYPIITACKFNDGCCAQGCNALNDNNCASVCGNGIKEGTEKCDDGDKSSGDGCSSSCTIESGWTCNTATPNVCTKNCVPNCNGKECGSDGCTGSCGSCTNAHGTTSCSSSGLCQPVCSPNTYTNCDGNRVNGCETCGCTPNCGTRECGAVPNGCGGLSATCGSCDSSTQTCVSGYCENNACTPNCGTRTCGPVPNGCGTSCGSCSGTCNNGVCTNNPPTGNTIIIDHTTTNINDISTSCINQVKANLHIAYSYTSHGTQIMAGLDALQAYNGNLYSYSLGGNPSQLDLKGYYGYGAEDGFDTGGCYDLSDCNGGGILTPTTDFLDGSSGSNINVIMWSWCDIAGHNIAGYINSMKTLITDYPYVHFVFITGHANGGGEGDSSDSQNEIIRNFVKTNSFCNTHQCILFDFADIENYDPDGNYFLDQNVDMALNYDGGNWGDEYIDRHPTGTNADLTSLLDSDYGCAHSDTSYGAYLNCALKGQAAWYMFAKIQGCA